MNFSSASKVLACIRAGDDIERVRGQNRTAILEAANCCPPLDSLPNTAKARLGLTPSLPHCNMVNLTISWLIDMGYPKSRSKNHPAYLDFAISFNSFKS